MQLQRQLNPATNVINAYGDDHVVINRQRHEGCLIVTPGEIRHPWVEGGFEALTVEHIAMLCTLAPEVVLIGTGARQRFPHPSLLRPLMEARIGFEVMDLAAACRTYNILADEGRNVAAGLIFDLPA